MKDIKKYTDNQIKDIDYVEVSTIWDNFKNKISNIKLKKYQKWGVLFYTLAIYFDFLLGIYFYSPDKRYRWYDEVFVYDPWYVDLMEISATTLLLLLIARLLTLFLKSELNED